MAVSSSRLVRILVAVVAVECAIALVARAAGLWEVSSGEARPADYLAAAGLLWVAVLALVARTVARRVDELGRRVLVQDEHLAAAEAPRRRLAAIVARTERLIGAPESLRVALQPVIDLASGRWVAVEALARFPDDGGQEAGAPETLLADAHEAGVGVALERLAVEAALATLPALPPGVRLSVNASPALILDPGFADLLQRCGPDRERLVVEITEHAAVSRYEDIHEALLPHRQRGLGLAVDDTGAGYASFAHVLRLRPDIIKLDRSLLADIDHDGARRAFVTAVVLMALELGASVTAEGVETPAELDTVRSLGVDAVQGFLLSRPSTAPATWATWAARDWLTEAGLASAGSGLRVRVNASGS